MDGIGARLKSRAQELGLSDTKVAERAGLSQTRYATYTIDKFEPDLATLKRICVVLNISPNELLGWSEAEAEDETRFLALKISNDLQYLKKSTLEILSIMVSALLKDSKN